MVNDETGKPASRKKGRKAPGARSEGRGSRDHIKARTKTPGSRVKARAPGSRSALGTRRPNGIGRKPVRRPGKRRVKPMRVIKPKEKKPGKPQRIDYSWMEEDPKDHLLSRFIHDSNNKVIGESIGVEGKFLIMKSGKRFYSVPMKNIVENEDNLSLKGKIDRAKARKLGEAWRKRALDPLYQKKRKL